MKKYDIGISWVDAVEEPFVEILKKTASKAGLSVYEITFVNLRKDFERVSKGELRFNLFIDRGSIDSGIFLLLGETLKRQGAKVINDPSSIVKFSSKVSLIESLKKADVPLPQIHIVNKKTSQKRLDEIGKELGEPFAIKPDYGGGFDEITLRARNGNDIRKFMDDNNSESYLIQEYIVPAVMNAKTAWWRIIYVSGLIVPLWWDPQNNFYQEFGNSEEEKTLTKKLENYMKKIAKITSFDLFSSEFTINVKNNNLVCIDYANQPIDLNTRENSDDALPKKVVKTIASQIVSSLI